MVGNDPSDIDDGRIQVDGISTPPPHGKELPFWPLLASEVRAAWHRTYPIRTCKIVRETCRQIDHVRQAAYNSSSGCSGHLKWMCLLQQSTTYLLWPISEKVGSTTSVEEAGDRRSCYRWTIETCVSAHPAVCLTGGWMAMDLGYCSSAPRLVLTLPM